MNNVHVHIPYRYLDTYLSVILENSCNIELFVPASVLDTPPLTGLEKVKKALNNGTSLTWHAPFSLKTWREVLDNYPNTNFAIENVFENRPDTLERLIKEMDSERFRYCFDTGHFNVFSKIPLREWLERVGHYIAEVHLHDNHGKEDEHLGLGEGNFDFDTLFNFLRDSNRQPIFTLEAHSKEGVLKSIEYLKEKL